MYTTQPARPYKNTIVVITGTFMNIDKYVIFNWLFWLKFA